MHDDNSIDTNNTYVLTIYKLSYVNKIHIVSCLVKSTTTINICNAANTEIYNVLKYQQNVSVKAVILNCLGFLYDEIKESGWEKWKITEVFRGVCNSQENAQIIAKQQINILSDIISDNVYQCESCKYSSNIECDWIRHQTGKRHLEKLKLDKKDRKPYQCDFCGTGFLSRSYYYKHKRECSPRTSSNLPHYFIDVNTECIELSVIKLHNNDIANFIYKNQALISQNAELRELLVEQHHKMMELALQPTTIVNNNNNNNNITNNNHFNLNVFLNETCKDAMSLTQFVNSLEINTETLEYTGINGYVAGISKIFTDGLRQLDVNARPIHCTDLKRETLYIKEKDGWTKDNEEKTKFHNALNIVARRNLQQVREWVKINPRCDIIDSAEYQLHIDIMTQCVGGGSEYANNRKILRNVAKEVLIDKTLCVK